MSQKDSHGSLSGSTISFNFTSYSTSDASGIGSYVGFVSVVFVIDNVAVAYKNRWINEAYKTINITSKLSEVENGSTLLTWLQANATKQ